jgi:NB-ARC domain
MNVTETLQFADRLMFKQEKRHLDEIEELIIKGTWEDKTYDEIAKECKLSESRVRNIGAELLQTLSKSLGESVNKDNFRSTFKRLQVHTSPIQNFCNVGNNNSHFSQNLYNSPENNQNNDPNTQSKSVYHDLKLAPKIINFYQRETDLTKLSNAVFAQNTPLISVLGLSGIGKTTLVKRFVDLNLDKFEVIIWKSLKYPKSLTLLINDFLTVCKLEPKETLDDKLTQLFDLLTDKKCLIILDDLQNIFISGDFAGKYQPEYQDYQNFFTMITETVHQSNVILIS